MEVPQKIKNRQSCDPANLLLNIYPKEMKFKNKTNKKIQPQEFPGSLVVKTQCFHRCGPEFDPWSGN